MIVILALISYYILIAFLLKKKRWYLIINNKQKKLFLQIITMTYNAQSTYKVKIIFLKIKQNSLEFYLHIIIL